MTNDTGYQTLEVIAKADRFNHWMYETIRPFCQRDILEIGSGIGNISQFFIQDGYRITLSDMDKNYQEKLKKKFEGVKTLSIDLVHENFATEYRPLFASFDTIFFLNVLEHIQDQELAIENSRYFLKPGGYLVVLVPAYSFLFSKMDKELHHYRRYTVKRLEALLSKKHFVPRNGFYFNALGIAGWLYGKIFGFSSLKESQMNRFNQMVPFAKFLDRIVLKKTGLSAVVVAQKKGS